jgi:iron complex transport system ATP-binding protein
MSIRLWGITAGYGKKPVVENVDLEIKAGEVTVLIGPNGCGKSTLLKTIARILRPSAGCIDVDGKNALTTPAKQMGRTIAYLPQSPAVPTAITVEQLVGYGRAPHQSILGFRSALDIEMVDTAIATTGLGGLRKSAVSELSGGQRQRAFLAMSLAQDTPYIMLCASSTRPVAPALSCCTTSHRQRATATG